MPDHLARNSHLQVPLVQRVAGLKGRPEISRLRKLPGYRNNTDPPRQEAAEPLNHLAALAQRGTPGVTVPSSAARLSRGSCAS